MAEAVLLLALEKLEELQDDKGEFLEGVAGQMRSVIHDLQMMLARLGNSGLKLEIRDIYMSVVEIAYDVNDTIDTLISNVENYSKRRRPRRRLLLLPFEAMFPSKSKVAHLQGFRKEIHSIKSRMLGVRYLTYPYYHITAAGERSAGSVGLEPPQVQEEDVVGLEGEVKLLIKEAIFQSTEENTTLSIVGMDGVGKTTLASLLYNHADVAPHFQLRAWVNVSDQRDANEIQILTELFQQLGMSIEPPPPQKYWDRHTLVETLHRRLLYRTYFLVFDNVWSRRNLDIVYQAIPLRENKGRLVITSRNRYGMMKGRLEYIHEMKILDGSRSWELFLKKLLPGDGKCPKQLERIGRQIVMKCDGLPLAIQEAATKLAAEKTQSESVWEEFLESMDLSATSASLELSYDILSPEEKLCFLSLGFFKEGITIRVDKLCNVWVAGGMLSSKHRTSKTYEEIGRANLDILIGQYLIQVKDRTMDYRVKNCKINYNLHRLAIAKAKEEILFEVLTKKGSNNRSYHRSRHRAVCCSREKFSYSTGKDKHLVSLFYRGGGNFDASPSYWKSFESLKILDLEGFGLKTLPKTVGELITLKYLGLRNNYIQELPGSLGQLGKLEVLDIAQNFMVQVPNIIWKMESLRHLYMSDIICEEPLKIDKLCNLQTLTYISVDNWTYEVSGLEMMTSLRKLGIAEVDENSEVNKLLASLAELKNLDCLILRGCRFRSIPELEGLHILQGLRRLKLDGLLTRLPSASNFPPDMEYLSLSNSCLDEDPVPILEKLPELIYLKLRNAYTGQKMVISPHGFPVLKTMCIEELWHLTSVQVGEGAMPRLKQLEINGCPNLKTLPEEMSNVEKLKMVTTKGIAAMIRDSSFISKIQQVDIQP